MVETLAVPEHDRFQIITEHEADGLIYDPSYLGINRSDDVVLVQITLSAGLVEAVAKHEYDSEDIVTDLINRAEFSIDEARKRGGDTVVALETPKL